MSPLDQFSPMISRELKKVKLPMISRVQMLCEYNEGEEADDLMVIFRTKGRLTSAIENAKPNTYPMQLFHNTRHVFSAVAAELKKGSLVLADSELMTAVLSVTCQLETGATFDQAGDVVQVPQVNFKANPRKMPMEAQLWQGALLVNDWPQLPSTPPKTGTPRLVVIHLPEVLTEKGMENAARLTFGWNFSQIVSRTVIRGLGQYYRGYGEKAQTILSM